MSTLSPGEIATLLGRPVPTGEQQTVITAPLAPGVVVAGAGSGKTETMAARVVWLVANGHVAPDQVLGLTFTRKAATELGARVRSRLAALNASGRVRVPDGEPTVSTYDAFASRIVAEHGTRLGIEPGRRMLSPAGAWQRAARLVFGWDGPMQDVDAAPETVIADLLDLHEQAAAHLVDLADVQHESAELLELMDRLPPGRGQKLPLLGALRRVQVAQRTRLRLLPLVERYRADLGGAGLADFATMAYDAATIATTFPAVGQQMRAQYRLVLLDEFQDTSHAQLDLLLALFGAGHPVTAVGDPFQSIYAWRGANADTLASFVDRFAGAIPVPRYSLRTSFRNAVTILDVANAVADPLRSGADRVDTLVPVTDASAGQVRVALHRTRADQAQAVAAQIDRLWRSGHDRAAPPSVGVLVRKRDEIPLVEEALRERGLPVEVVGLDGLLTVPEVADTVALLQVAVDPARGDALMRLLTGPLLQFGPRDLATVARWARRLTPDPAPEQPTWEVPRAGAAECLTSPPPPGWLSPAADERLRLLRTVVSRVRSRLSRPVPEVVSEAVSALGLDVETLTRARRTGGPGTAHLNRLVDEAASFADLAPQAGVAEFLDYVKAAVGQERGLRRASEVHLASRVQLLTVHSAKGLEWDVVAVVGLTSVGFPSDRSTGPAWLTDPGTLPYPLRGDAERLPRFAASGATNQSDLGKAKDAFARANREADLAEERRLGYVAVTRARQVLLCHGYRWGTRAKPLEPSPFLLAAKQTDGVSVDVWTDDPGEAPDPAENPPVWPADPLGVHREALADGAGRVRRAIAGADGTSAGSDAASPGSDAASAGSDAASVADDGTSAAADGPSAVLSGWAAEWSTQVDLLLAEQADAEQRMRAVRLPGHLSATQLVAANRDPEEFLRRLRRPMPVRPRVEARQGTAFHVWVEQRFGNPRLLDLDELPGAADILDRPAGAELAELQQAFLASDWAHRTPIEIEAPFEMVVDGVVVRGRADAVFADGDGLLVVDWKTGPPPTSAAEVRARSAQLAAYRQAFAALYDLPPHRVRAVFHHVREGVTIDEPVRDDVLVPSAVSAVATPTG